MAKKCRERERERERERKKEKREGVDKFQAYCMQGVQVLDSQLTGRAGLPLTQGKNSK